MTGLQAGRAILGRGEGFPELTELVGCQVLGEVASEERYPPGSGTVALPGSGKWRSRRSSCSKWSANSLHSVGKGCLGPQVRAGGQG